VSNLVRNVLEDVFDVVESVTGNVGDLVDDIVGEVQPHRRDRIRRRTRRAREDRRQRSAAAQEFEDRPEEDDPEEPEVASTRDEPELERKEFPDVIAWQPLILNGEQSCSDCERTMSRGDRSFIGMVSSGLSGVYLCSRCMAARR